MTATTSAGGASPLTLFPHGFKFNATDVFLGSGRIDSIQITAEDAFGASAVLTVYDAITVATGRVVIGGTTTTESYRVIAGATLVDALGEPYSEAAPNAQITGLRVMTSQIMLLDRVKPNIIIPLGLDCVNGMVVSLTAPSITCSVAVAFTPWVSGGTRKRRTYAVGSTTKVEGPARTNIPL